MQLNLRFYDCIYLQKNRRYKSMCCSTTEVIHYTNLRYLFHYAKLTIGFKKPNSSYKINCNFCSALVILYRSLVLCVILNSLFLNIHLSIVLYFYKAGFFIFTITSLRWPFLAMMQGLLYTISYGQHNRNLSVSSFCISILSLTIHVATILI